MSDKSRSGFLKMSHLPTNVTISVSEEHGSEIAFEVSEASEGGYDARALGHGMKLPRDLAGRELGGRFARDEGIVGVISGFHFVMYSLLFCVLQRSDGI